MHRFALRLVRCITCTLLAGVAWVVSWLARRFTPRSLPFAWRQGVANLYRPGNRTLLLLVSLGLGTFLMMTLYLSRDTLLGQLRLVGGGDRPNLMLFDIQDDQVAPLEKLLQEQGAPVRQHAAIVTMRITSIKGRAVTDILKEKVRTQSRQLTDWIVDQLKEDPAKSRLLEQLWKRAEKKE